MDPGALGGGGPIAEAPTGALELLSAGWLKGAGA